LTHCSSISDDIRYHEGAYIKKALARKFAFGDRTKTAKRGRMSQLRTISVCSASPADILTIARTYSTNLVRIEAHCKKKEKPLTTGITIFSSLFNESSTSRLHTPARDQSLAHAT
jgi:hypothetical protein